jgi:hypothetical protein
LGEADDEYGWLKPSLDAAREAVKCGEGMTLDEYRAHLAGSAQRQVDGGGRYGSKQPAISLRR